MYLDFFKLKETPFNLTPDTDFIFPSSQYSQAINYLLYGIEQKKGFILITGEVGAGKTTLCRSLLRKLDRQNVEIAIVLNSFLSAFELLKSINKDFSLKAEGNNKEELIEELNNFLLKQKEAGKNVVLVIDECQNLSFPVLEQIRMLSNLETEKEKLLQIIMVGQPEFQKTLVSNELRQLNQRITVRYHMLPLNLKETEQYICHRIKKASLTDTLPVSFTVGSFRKIHQFTNGIPRQINVLTDYVLLNAFIHETTKITKHIVKEATKEVIGKKEKTSKKKIAKKLLLSLLIILFLSFPLIIIHYFSENFILKSKELRENTKIEDTIKTTPQYYLEKDYKPSLPLIQPETNQSSEASKQITAKEETPQEPILQSIKPIDMTAFTLLHAWGITKQATTSYIDTHQKQAYPLDEIALDFNFKTLRLWTDLATLQRLGMPAILKLKNNSDGLVTTIENNTITINQNNKITTYTQLELAQIWDGETTFLYEDNFSLNTILYPTLTGEQILRLQEQLWKLNFYHNAFTGVFDAPTEEAVKSFQTSYQLFPDGVVGKEMQLLLYRIFREDHIPKIATKLKAGE